MNKIINELKKNSLFGYLLQFCAIVILIILVMGAYLYQFYYNTIYSDFLNANESDLSAVSNRHENDMAIVDNVVSQISLSDHSVEFKLREVPTKSIVLKEQLHRYVSVSQFFSQIFFYYHEDTYLYNHATSIDIRRFLSEGIVLAETSSEELYGLLSNNESDMQVLKEQDIDGYLSKSSKNTTFDTAAVVYFRRVAPKNTSTLVFIVGETYYDELLNCEADERKQNFILYDKQVIVTRGDLISDSESLTEKLIYMEDTQYQITIDGKKFLVTMREGESGLTYCTLQSMKIFQNKILTGQWGILFLLLICSIPASLVIVTLSRKLSGRIRAINVLLSEDEDAYYNLENIETGIRTLVESNKEISVESLPLRRTRFISNFIRNEYTDRAAVIAAGQKAGLAVDRKYYIVVLMGDRENSNEGKAHKMMLADMGQRENEDGFGIHLINKNQSLFVIFGDDIPALETLLQSFFQIGTEYCEDFVMSVSVFHQDYMEASEAYLEADTAFDNRLLVDNSRILRFADVALKERVDLLPDACLQSLKNAIRFGDETEAEKAILEICTYLKSNGQSLLTFRILYNDIINMMIREWNGSSINFENIYNVFALSQCLTITDFNDILCEVCSKLMNSKTANDAEKSDMVNKAVDYMKTNYQEAELNMSSLAEYLNVSSVTLAVEFKNAMGISPSEYLAINRIENAKRLLRNTQLKIWEVSVMVGYEDDHVFTRRFKKYTGRTPGQYRIENQKSL